MNELFDEKQFHEWLENSMVYLQTVPPDKAREAVIAITRSTVEYLNAKGNIALENAQMITTMFK